MAKHRIYDGETCRVYYSNYWLHLMPFVLLGLVIIAGGLTVLIALGAELRRTGALSDAWWTVLSILVLFGLMICTIPTSPTAPSCSGSSTIRRVRR